MIPNVVRGQHVWLLLGLVLFAGCVIERKEPDATVEDKGQVLTAEIAKQALLEMDDKQIPTHVFVPNPNEELIHILTAEQIEAGAFLRGRWNCNLKEKAFYIFKDYPNADRHKYHEVAGVFQRTPNGKWVGKITHCDSK